VRRLLSPDWRVFLRMMTVRPDWVWQYARRRLGRGRGASPP